MTGFVDYGTNDEKCEVPATQVLVFLLTSINQDWKLPVGYFFIHGMTAAKKASLVQLCIEKAFDVGVKVTSVVCDGPSTHFSMAKELGALLTADTMKTVFPHPSDPSQRIFFLLDAAHMLKLLRNCLEALKIIIDPQGRKVEWRYFEELWKIQKHEGLRLGNKIRERHIKFKAMKMKVSLASQLFSKSVADAMEFCLVDLKLPQFRGCEATIEFIRKVNDLFDFLNSRSLFSSGFKSALKKENKSAWSSHITATYYYIKNLRNTDGNFLHTTPRKTSILGFMALIKSTVGLYEEYVGTGKMAHLKTYKLSQVCMH